MFLMKQYRISVKTLRKSPVHIVGNAIPVLRMFSVVPKWSLDDFVKTDESIPIPVFAQQLNVLERYGLIERAKNKTAEWTITSSGTELLKRYEEIERMLVYRK